MVLLCDRLTAARPALVAAMLAAGAAGFRAMARSFKSSVSLVVGGARSPRGVTW